MAVGVNPADSQVRNRNERAKEDSITGFYDGIRAIGELLPKIKEEAHLSCSEGTLHHAILLVEVYDLIGLGVIATRSNMAFEMRSAVARTYIAIANAALERRCFERARELYLHVIETYVGSGYAAIRQRAQIGIDDVRAAMAAQAR